MLKIRKASFVAAAVGLLFSLGANAGQYQVLNTLRIGGEGGWDYLSYDASSGRLFISRGTHVIVVNPVTGAVVGEIADTPGVHGIALAPELDKGFISNGKENTVTVFSSSTLKTMAKIPVTGAENPDFIAYDSFSKQVVAFGGRSHNASVIDARTDKLIATIALSGKPEAAVADGRGTVFVDIEDRNELASIDMTRHVVTATWPLVDCDEPSGLAMDTATRRLFVGCHNKTLLVINADNGKTVGKLPIGDGVDAAAFDPEKKLAFSSQGDGTLTLVKESAADKFGVQQTVTTLRGARTMALNTKDHLVYLVTADFEEAPAAAGQKARRTMKPDSFKLLVVGEK